MLRDYSYGPTRLPLISFDARFAIKYGITEAIIFNDLYFDLSMRLKIMQRRNRTWNEHNGWIEEGGYWWMRCTEEYLFDEFSILFSKRERKVAIKNLCDAGLLCIRPSMTAGYYWIRIGEESDRTEVQ